VVPGVAEHGYQRSAEGVGALQASPHERATHTLALAVGTYAQRSEGKDWSGRTALEGDVAEEDVADETVWLLCDQRQVGDVVLRHSDPVDQLGIGRPHGQSHERPDLVVVGRC
jgi:hypothetical protein